MKSGSSSVVVDRTSSIRKQNKDIFGLELCMTRREEGREGERNEVDINHKENTRNYQIVNDNLKASIHIQYRPSRTANDNL